jgi:hypothetical protein
MFVTATRRAAGPSGTVTNRIQASSRCYVPVSGRVDGGTLGRAMVVAPPSATARSSRAEPPVISQLINSEIPAGDTLRCMADPGGRWGAPLAPQFVAQEARAGEVGGEPRWVSRVIAQLINFEITTLTPLPGHRDGRSCSAAGRTNQVLGRPKAGSRSGRLSRDHAGRDACNPGRAHGAGLAGPPSPATAREGERHRWRRTTHSAWVPRGSLRELHGNAYFAVDQLRNHQ